MSKNINELVVELLRREGFDVMKFHEKGKICRFVNSSEVENYKGIQKKKIEDMGPEIFYEFFRNCFFKFLIVTFVLVVSGILSGCYDRNKEYKVELIANDVKLFKINHSNSLFIIHEKVYHFDHEEKELRFLSDGAEIGIDSIDIEKIKYK